MSASFGLSLAQPARVPDLSVESEGILGDIGKAQIMTSTGEEPRDWTETIGQWVGARWRWLLVAVALLFAFNNLVGLVVGGMGLIAVANGIMGRVLKAKRIVQQVQGLVTHPDDSEKSG
jgi:hypothetical protein